MTIEFASNKLAVKALARILVALCLNAIYMLPGLASDHIETAGDWIQVVIPGVAYGTTFYIDDKQGRIQFHDSLLTSVLLTHGLKLSIDKQRPNGGGQSFPSGHTSAAFQGAAFIQQRYGWIYGAPAYLGASFVGYSRIESENHYLEDVIAGAMIGIVSSLYFTEPYKKNVITPIISSGYFGLSYGKRW